MKELDEYAGKRMPYVESDDYVARLIDRCADRAVAGEHKTKSRPMPLRWLSAGVSVAAVLVAGVMVFSKFNTDTDSMYESYRNSNSMSLSEVLTSMSDEDLMCVSDYEIEDITEYEEE